MHPQAIIVDSTHAEETYFLQAARDQIPSTKSALIELPDKPETRLAWISKLDSTALSGKLLPQFQAVYSLIHVRLEQGALRHISPSTCCWYSQSTKTSHFITQSRQERSLNPPAYNRIATSHREASGELPIQLSMAFESFWSAASVADALSPSSNFYAEDG